MSASISLKSIVLVCLQLQQWLLLLVCSQKYDITLVSPRNYFLYTPLLPAVATGTVEERSIVEPIRRIMAGKVDFNQFEQCQTFTRHVSQVGPSCASPSAAAHACQQKGTSGAYHYDISCGQKRALAVHVNSLGSPLITCSGSALADPLVCGIALLD